MSIRRSNSSALNAWNNARSRCINPTMIGYAKQGGAGITMCQRWISSFSNFMQDMGPKPDNSRLERHDRSGNYEPQNCFWKLVVARKPHRKTERHYGSVRPGKKAEYFLTHKGRTETLVSWAAIQQIPYETLLWRNHRGWTAEQVLGMEPPPSNSQVRKPYTRHSLTFNGKTQGPRQWAAELNMPPRVVYDRIARGWTTEQALTRPIRKHLPR